MKRTSNLNAVKSVAHAFLYMDVEKTPVSPIVVMHPIFETGIIALAKDGQLKSFDITQDAEALRNARLQVANKIDSQNTVAGVYCIIRKSYRLTFLKFIEQHLSIDDMSELLSDAWVTSENPNQDTNVSLALAVKWFRKANKKALMTADELNFYNEIPQSVTVYRGVAVGRNPIGLSWTQNIRTARWFANRFNTDKQKGYIQSATIDKSNVLAYFNSRDEDEIVVDTPAIKHLIETIE